MNSFYFFGNRKGKTNRPPFSEIVLFIFEFNIYNKLVQRHTKVLDSVLYMIRMYYVNPQHQNSSHTLFIIWRCCITAKGNSNDLGNTAWAVFQSVQNVNHVNNWTKLIYKFKEKRALVFHKYIIICFLVKFITKHVIQFYLYTAFSIHNTCLSIYNNNS